jgi:hypothetical protein
MAFHSQMRRAGRASRLDERSYILLIMLLAMALLTIFPAAIVPTIKFQIERDREEELIHRGTRYSLSAMPWECFSSCRPTGQQVVLKFKNGPIDTRCGAGRARFEISRTVAARFGIAQAAFPFPPSMTIPFDGFSGPL